MAVKLPPDTYINQVLTLKGTKDNVYSRIDGSLVGYVKDGKFVQTIDELPKLTPKKKPVVDKEFSASIQKISALNAIPALEQDAEYYKNEAEDINNSASERAQALAKYNALQAEIAAKQKEAGQAGTVVEGFKQKSKATDARKRTEEIKGEYSRLEEQFNLILDPTSDKAGQIKNKMNKLVEEFRDAYSTVVNTPISLTAARLQMRGQTPDATAGTQTNAPTAVNPATAAGFPTGTTTAQNTATKPAVTKTAQTPVVDKTYTPTTKPNVEPTTINPVTGEKIKVSSILPDNGAKTPPAAVGPNLPTTVAKENAAATIAEKYGLSEALFKNVDSLKTIFEEYVRPNSGMTDDELARRIRNDVWYKKNSGEIKARFVQYYNYQDLKNSGQADGSTDYEMQISRIERALAKRASEIGSAAASDPTALRQAAENLYITNREDDVTFIDDFLAASIRPVSGMIGGKVTEGYSGAALANYKQLVKTARENGFQVSDILPGGANEQQVLAGIASGTIDINRVAQDARKLAAQGQPQYVRDLLAQGYNLNQVFAPYRQTMANVLEIGDPDQIDLNDPLLRSAITDKGDMNLYDFRKSLRQDNRWQYTEQARNDVSSMTLGVLRDFGFQG